MINITVDSSRKKCLVDYNEKPLFFSLVDYRNNYFTSNDPKRIIEFYNGFENRDQLIRWLKERPKGVANIHEVEGDKEIIVVIPTADFTGKYARECRENIFKDLHIVFVESAELPDPYFNYAHNCNVGIRKAMEYNPKWIVVSNDDMHAIDDISVLNEKLKAMDNNKFSAIFINESKYHSIITRISKPGVMRNYFSLIKFFLNYRKEKGIKDLLMIKLNLIHIEKKFDCTSSGRSY